MVAEGSQRVPAVSWRVARCAVPAQRPAQAVLSDAGLVRTRRRGRERICSLEPAGLADACAWLDRISRQWDGALSRLQRFVED